MIISYGKLQNFMSAENRGGTGGNGVMERRGDVRELGGEWGRKKGDRGENGGRNLKQ